MSDQPRTRIEELEKLLDHDDEIEIEILPNGEVRSKPAEGSRKQKPLTLRENLGGEYAPPSSDELSNSLPYLTQHGVDLPVLYETPTEFEGEHFDDGEMLPVLGGSQDGAMVPLPVMFDAIVPRFFRVEREMYQLHGFKRQWRFSFKIPKTG